MWKGEFVNVEDFFIQLAHGKEALLILDYDGTLAPFVQNPQQAYPYPGIMEKIQTIMKDPSVRVVILSGRALDALVPLLLLDPLPELWGSHGGESLGFIKQLSNQVRQALAEAAQEANQFAPELLCEIKPLSVALHWRGKDPKLARTVIESWKDKTARLPLELHAFDGGVELRSLEVNKGNAVKTLMEEVSPDTLIAYLGDDFTDEEAFAILGDRALKVLVRDKMRDTRADLRLSPPEELFNFFDRWIDTKLKGA